MIILFYFLEYYEIHLGIVALVNSVSVSDFRQITPDTVQEKQMYSSGVTGGQGRENWKLASRIQPQQKHKPQKNPTSFARSYIKKWNGEHYQNDLKNFAFRQHGKSYFISDFR